MLSPYLLASVLLVTNLPQSCSSRCPTNLKPGPTLVPYGRTHHCYEFILEHKLDWSHAQQECVRRGGNLLQIRDMQEQTFVMSTLHSLGFTGTGVWLGLSDTETEGKFIWVTGDEPAYTYWGEGQGPQAGGLFNPHLIHNLEDCVLLKFTDSGHWHDYHCTNILFFYPEYFNWVCQYEMVNQTSAWASTTAAKASATITILSRTTPSPTTTMMGKPTTESTTTINNATAYTTSSNGSTVNSANIIG